MPIRKEQIPGEDPMHPALHINSKGKETLKSGTKHTNVPSVTVFAHNIITGKRSLWTRGNRRLAREAVGRIHDEQRSDN
jgi:hypothetical protein